ncbi:hypothetical protein TNCV_3078731 [Trichonephila clavipes]|nr:hypothetical protein TNCV_3078731 [Trichonephila clavipes]
MKVCAEEAKPGCTHEWDNNGENESEKRKEKQRRTSNLQGRKEDGEGCGSQWSRYRIMAVMSSSPVPLKTHRVVERCTLNLSRAQTASRWCGVVVRSGNASSGVVLIT